MVEIKNKKLKDFTFIDLFAGIGGFRLALESFGAHCVFSSEVDKFASEVYYDNYGEFPAGDITKINENDVPDHDILCAGFPCQPFSISGKQKGFEDSRGTLFFDVARIIKAKKPKLVFMENVKNFVSHDNGKTFEVVKNIINELGYSFFFSVLNAQDYDIPQKRERVYMVCFRNDLNVHKYEFPMSIPLKKHVEDLMESEANICQSMYKTRKDIILYSNVDYSDLDRCIKVGFVNKGGQGDRIYSPKGIGITLSATGGGYYAKTGGYLTERGVRKLTLRECARLMGFPESFKICKSISQGYKQFGNSVVIDVLQYIVSSFSLYL